MKTRSVYVGMIGVFFLLLYTSVAWADKSSVEIEAPNQAAKGSEVVVKLNVSHSANNFIHYTDWVVVKANGKEIARWEYSALDKPEGQKFTKQVKITVDKDVEIEAQAHCNMHGSAGISKRIIFVK